MVKVDFCQQRQEKYHLMRVFFMWILTRRLIENTKQECIFQKIFLIKHLLMINTTLI